VKTSIRSNFTLRQSTYEFNYIGYLPEKIHIPYYYPSNKIVVGCWDEDIYLETPYLKHNEAISLLINNFYLQGKFKKMDVQLPGGSRNKKQIGISIRDDDLPRRDPLSRALSSRSGYLRLPSVTVDRDSDRFLIILHLAGFIFVK
jgi:hypothetical protein